MRDVHISTQVYSHIVYTHVDLHPYAYTLTYTCIHTRILISTMYKISMLKYSVKNWTCAQHINQMYYIYEYSRTSNMIGLGQYTVRMLG